MAERGRYQFYDRDWDDYESLCEWFNWEIPERFNVTEATVEHWAQESPSRDAVLSIEDDGEDEHYTYDELQTAVAGCAAALADRGIREGDRVAINAPQRVETLITHLATWKLGAVSVPLSVRFGPDALAYRLNDCTVEAAVVDESHTGPFSEALRADSVTSVNNLLVVGTTVGEIDGGVDTTDFWAAVEEATSTIETVSTRADDDAMIIYTSGTTGDPKGVRQAHRFLLGHLPTAVTGFFNMNLRSDERVYTPVEWAWVGPLWAFTLPVLYYGKTVLANRGRFDPERTLDIVDQYDVTRMLGPATVWRRLQNVDSARSRFETDSVEVIMSAGESMGESELAWVENTFENAAVHEGYGQTEAMNLVMDCSALFPKRSAKMGKPTPGVDVRILDPETGESTVPTGEVGEIAVRYDDGHPLCFKEYWNKPERTSEKVQDGWLLTEDLGFADEDGYFEFHSRKDDVIICSGYRISPEEVQKSLLTHEAVTDAGVIGVPDDDHGEVPKAFVVVSEGVEPDEELTSALQSYVKNELAMYEYPRRIEYRTDLPTTGSGKVDRTTLQSQEP